MWMLHSPNMRQSYEMWKKAVRRITLAKLNPSLMSAWPPQMLINEYYKKKRQSVNRKPRALKKVTYLHQFWPHEVHQVVLLQVQHCQEQLEGPPPISEQFAQSVHSCRVCGPWTRAPYIALCACSKESYECIEFPTLGVNLKDVAERVYWVLLVFCDGREDHADNVEVHEWVQYWRLSLSLCLFVPLCVGLEISPVHQFWIVGELRSPLITEIGCQHVQFSKQKLGRGGGRGTNTGNAVVLSLDITRWGVL